MTGGRERRTEGGKEGRQEERNKSLAPNCCANFPLYTCYFQRAARPTKFASAGFKRGEHREVDCADLYATMFSMCTVQMITLHVASTIPLAALIFKKPQNSIQLDALSNIKFLQVPSGQAVYMQCNGYI